MGCGGSCNGRSSRAVGFIVSSLRRFPAHVCDLIAFPLCAASPPPPRSSPSPSLAPAPALSASLRPLLPVRSARPSLPCPRATGFPADPSDLPSGGRRTTEGGAAGSGSSAPPSTSGPTALAPRSRLSVVCDALTVLFPLWAVLGVGLAYVYPPSYAFMLRGNANSRFEFVLGLLMLSMGVTLSTRDLKACLARPVPILAGIVAKYTIMPGLAVAVAKVARLPPALATGLILLGCCPAGQASNVTSLIGHGDVALSVLMTAVSTLSAAVVTPLLSAKLVGKMIPVSAWALAKSTARLVLVPTLLGIALNELFPRAMRRVKDVMPVIACFLTVLVIGTPVSRLTDVITSHGFAMAKYSTALHVLAYFFGYLAARLVGFRERTARTISMQTGMQSAAIGYALSTAHFSDPLVAVPSGISIALMVWVGATLAVIWRQFPIDDGFEKDD